PKTFPAKQVIWNFSRDVLEQALLRTLGASTMLGGSGGTVAHMNFLVAAALGCSPLILIGQDLAFPADGGKDHVDGAVLANDFKLEPNSKSNKTIFWVEGTEGGKVPTDRTFLFLKKHLEHLISLQSAPCINATEGGANIKGTEILSLAKAIQIYCPKPQKILTEIESHLMQSGHPNADQLVAWLETTLKKVKEIQKIIKETDKLTVEANKEIARLKKTGHPYQSFTALPARLQKQITKIDRGQEKSDQPMEIWAILNEFTGEGLRESERLKQEILRLQEQPVKYLEYALKNLERILYTNSVRIIALELLEKNLHETLSHHKAERQLLAAINNDIKNKQYRLDLARFYFNSGELVLAQPLFEVLHSTEPNSAEINFCLGCIATQQADHEKAAHYFQTATTLSPDFENKIRDFKQKLGDQHFDLWNNQQFSSILNRVIKYCPEHRKIRAQLDLIKITSAHKSSTPEQTDDLIRSWYKKLENDKTIVTTLTAEQVAEFYAHHGQLLMSETKFQDATKSFTKALDFNPKNPDYHILTTEAFFASGNFDLGVEHLKQAVTINATYAKHWEEIGDQLRENEQYQDAIASYEQCFSAQPENVSLLKKIGECYQALGMPDAALKVYTLLKQRLGKN
ncbi:MAG: hypothetical protein OEV64_08405, partial [Desulfobulbaceae bacterium]|nr:hypothetical protein [Desulfobulbaceae bacterium]